MLNLIMLIIGISGVIAIAVNFILEAINKLNSDHHAFAIINLYGSLTLLVYSAYNSIWLFVILNGFLTVVGIYGLYKVFQK